MTMRDVAVEYHRRGWNLLPMVVGKKKPVIKWKRWQTNRQSEADIASWFAGNYNIAVILGDASGGLYLRDFDSADAYHRWTDDHHDLAGTLPTVATHRGSHVYFTHHHRLVTRTFADGELRGIGALGMLPPSQHPEGGRYTWRIPLSAVIPTVNPFETGMIGKPVKRSGSSCTESTEEVSLSVSVVSVSPCPSLYKSGLNPKGIASLAIPSTEHQNHHHLFQLARICYTISHRRNNPLSQAELQDVFNAWHRMAAKHLRPEQSRDEYYFEFLEGLERVKYEIGNEPIVQAWERAQQNPMPKVAMQFQDPQVRLLVALCQELQRAAGDEPFYLAGRKAAWLLKHREHTTAANWLRGLARAKIIKVVKQGGPDTMKATRFKYLPTMDRA